MAEIHLPIKPLLLAQGNIDMRAKVACSGKRRRKKNKQLLNGGKAHLTRRNIKKQKIPQFIVGQCLDRDSRAHRTQSATVHQGESLERKKGPVFNIQHSLLIDIFI